MRGKATAGLLCGALVTLTASGCDYEGASSLPLPGGVGGDGYTVTMTFEDATNLVAQETCRASDVVIGSVESVELDDQLRARVVCRIDPSVQLAGNAVPVLRETSLLGERFVALDPPAGEPASGVLEPGSVLDASDSHVVPDVEVVFGALSQVLNGGGLAHVETISRELSTALGEADLGSTTRKLETFVGTLDEHRDDIVDALESVDRLASVLADQRQVIAGALESVPAGLAVLERQRPRLVRTIEQLGDLSGVVLPLIRRSKADTIADLEHLGPILEQLAAAKHRLADALEGVITFPFPSYTKYAAQGDYAGMSATITFDLDSLNKLIEAHSPQLPTGVPGLPELPDVPDLPGLPDLPDLPLDELLELLPDLDLPGALGDRLGGPLGGPLNGLGDRLPGRVTASTSDAAPQTLGDLLMGGAP